MKNETLIDKLGYASCILMMTSMIWYPILSFLINL